MNMMSSQLEKPRLRRSMDYAYEEMMQMQEMLNESVDAFDIGNDPPLDEPASTSGIVLLSPDSTHDSFLQLALNRSEVPPACEHNTTSVSEKRRALSEIRELKPASLFADEKIDLEVVAIVSSDEEESPKPLNLPTLEDAKESDGIVVRSNSSDFHRVYSTGKPSGWTLQASPVKKEQDTLNSLDCSAFVDVLKSIDADESAVQDSVAESKKWTTFDEPFEQRNGPESTEVSLSPRAQEEAAAIFSPSVFVDLDYSEISDGAEREHLVHQVEELTRRVEELTRIVRHMETYASPNQISTLTHESLGDQAQDVAFIIENTELLASTVNEEIACTTDWDTKKQSKGFSMKRMFRSRKGSLAEV